MPDKGPNILLITTDQQRTDSLSCYGAAHTHTPNLDRLGAEGAVCERAYCVNPVCTPARATIFSGLYPVRHGAWNVGMNVPGDVTMVSHRLGAQGYRRHYVGKAHFQAFGGSPEETMEPVHDAVFVECTDDPRGLRLKTVVTLDRKLTAYHGHAFGELYDLTADPGETKNLWDDPRYAADRCALLGRLLDHAEGLERRAPRFCYA